MSKGFKGDLSLGRKVPLKKTKVEVNQVEETVKEIHKVTPVVNKDPTSKASLKLPKSLYRQMKKRVVELDTTVQDYLKNLVIEDLSQNGQ